MRENGIRVLHQRRFKATTDARPALLVAPGQPHIPGAAEEYGLVCSLSRKDNGRDHADRLEDEKQAVESRLE
mgnify:CR=1 FL=1